MAKKTPATKGKTKTAGKKVATSKTKPKKPTATKAGQSDRLKAGMQKYLDQALSTLDKLGISARDDVPQELISLLEEVKHVDEAKVMAIANTIRHMSTFNALVRDNVENINVGNRYLEITQMFDSIREDSKTLIAQLDDGKISIPEKAQNLWMHAAWHPVRPFRGHR